jgi:hypothetical protein
MISSHAQSYPCLSLIFARLATGVCRQAQTRDDKAGAKGAKASHSYHIHPHYMARHGQPRRAFFVPF